MGLYKSVNSVISSVSRFLYLKRIKFGEMSYIKKKKRFYVTNFWSDEENKKYEDYWVKHYGKVFSKKWSLMYSKISGVFNESYIPQMLYTYRVEPTVNPIEYCNVLSNKNLLYTLYGSVEGVYIPKPFVMNNFGRFSDSNFKIISKEQAVTILNDVGSVLIKATVDSCGGRSVRIVKFTNGIDEKTGMTVGELFDEYGENFVVQELIRPSNELKKIGPTCLNTVRLITYIANDRVGHAPVSLRVGINGMIVDNMTSGGLCIGIEDDGKLHPKAYYLEFDDTFGNFLYEHPDTHVKFKDLTIPQIPEMIELGKKLHSMTPQVGVISWDMSVNCEGKIVLIEANFCDQSTDFPQMLTGRSIFGNDTPYFLNLIRQKK